MQRIGVISDTHGLLRPEALAFLAGCDHILHGGDICERAVLDTLRAIAPVTAVRGNNDRGAWADALPTTTLVRFEDVVVYVVHDIADLDVDPKTAGVHVVVTGHSHKPLIREADGVLFMNPGSAGPRRFKLPVSIGELVIDGAAVTARLADLAPSR